MFSCEKRQKYRHCIPIFVANTEECFIPRYGNATMVERPAWSVEDIEKAHADGSIGFLADVALYFSAENATLKAQVRELQKALEAK